MPRTKGTYFTANFRMPHLYRDDLEALESLLVNDLRPAKFIVAFAGQEYTRLTEIPAEVEFAHVLVIYTESPEIRLKFSRSWTELFCGATDDKTLEVLHRMAAILQRSERPGLWALTRFAPWLAPLLCFGVPGSVFGFIAMGILGVRALYAVALWSILIALWWVAAYYQALVGSACIDFRNRRADSRRSHNLRQQAILGLAGVGLGAVISFFATRILSR